MRKPETDRWWTTLYFGSRGSGKTYHQAREAWYILKYLDALYTKFPYLKRAILFTNQKFNATIEKEYLGRSLFYWAEGSELRYCPRPSCWRSLKPHRLHGAYVVIDDISTILPPDQWSLTPMWFRKMFMQGRHFGIRVLANCQDPFAIDINFRRCVDIGFRFRKIISSKDPDETKPEVKKIWGIYCRRRIKADLLWKLGDMNEEEIIIFTQQQELMQKELGGSYLMDTAWIPSWHIITRKLCNIYDTTQDVPEYRPQGYEHREYSCIDPAHPHCKHHKIVHELV